MHLVLNSKFCCSTSKAMYSRTPANGHASKMARAGNRPIFMVPNFISLLCLKFMLSNGATPLLRKTVRLSGPSGQSAPLMRSFSMLVAGPGQAHTKVSMHND